MVFTRTVVAQIIASEMYKARADFLNQDELWEEEFQDETKSTVTERIAERLNHMTRELPAGVTVQIPGEGLSQDKLAEIQAMLDSTDLPLPWDWQSEVIALDEDEELIGVIVSCEAEITIVVDPTHQRCGIGTAMLSMLEGTRGSFYAIAGSEAGAALLFHFFDHYTPEYIEWDAYDGLRRKKEAPAQEGVEMEQQTEWPKVLVKTAQEMRKMGLPHDEDPEFVQEIIKDEIVGKRRWVVEYELIFRLVGMPDDLAYRTYYEAGATEQQDQSPWEYEKTVESILVRQVPTVVVDWVEVR